jgi:hypothetical protein
MVIDNFIKGVSGVGAVELINQSQIPLDPAFSEIFKLMLQLVIAIATLISIKKNNDGINNKINKS